MSSADAMPRACIFCGAKPVTKEHMWAAWLRPYLPHSLPSHRVRSAVIFPTRTDEAVKQRAGDPHSRTVRCVCRSCNNEWMSSIQSAAKPLLLPFLHAESTSLNRKAQVTIATWVTMMVMVSEFVDPQMVAVSHLERGRFLHDRRPQSHWRIWIGRYSAPPPGVSRWSHNVMALAHDAAARSNGDGPDEPNTQTSTICLGEHLVVHVMSSVVARGYIRRWTLPPQHAPGFAQIWPVTSSIVDWPGDRPVMSASAVENVAMQMLRRVEWLAKRRALLGH